MLTDFTFLISILSATAATGLFIGSKFVITTSCLFEVNLPFHLRGLNGLIGVTASLLELRESTGPLTERL